MESQTDSQIFERIEPVIAAFAAAGRREWRDGRIDSKLLADLPAIREQVAILDAAERTSPDTEANAIEAAIEVAIKTLRDPFRSAALDHFAFTDEKINPLGKGAREQLAAKSFTKSDRWYRKPSSRYLGLSPHDYVIALVACALCKVSDPIAWLAKRYKSPSEGSAADAVGITEVPKRRRFTKRQSVQIIGASAALLGSAAIVVLLLASRGSNRGASIPPLGSIADAANGKISPASSLPAHPAATAGQIAGGGILHACVVGPTRCSYPLQGQPIVANAGDILLFDVRLHDPGPAPLSEVKLSVSTSRQLGSAEVTAIGEFPSGDSRSHNIETAFSKAVIVRFKDGKAHVLVYVPRSTALYDSSGESHLLTHLPEGLLSAGGITLTNVGAPRACWDCDLTYVRYVAFSMRVG